MSAGLASSSVRPPATWRMADCTSKAWLATVAELFNA